MLNHLARQIELVCVSSTCPIFCFCVWVWFFLVVLIRMNIQHELFRALISSCVMKI